MTHVPARVAERIREDAVEEAKEQGLVRVIPATLQDPPHLDGDVDVEFGPSHVVVTATVGLRLVFEREYEFFGETIWEWQDV